MLNNTRQIYTIIVADDEVIERQYLQLQLNLPDEGFIVQAAAANGRQLLDAYVRYKPDIVIADISMPLLDGLEACRIIRQMDSKVFLLINTAYAEFDYAQNALNYGIDAFLLKPSDKDSIMDCLRSLIRRQSRISFSEQEKQIEVSDDVELYKDLNAFYEALTLMNAETITKSCEKVMCCIEEGYWGEKTRLILFNILLCFSSLIHQNPLFQEPYCLDNDIKSFLQLGGNIDENILRMMLISSFKRLLINLQSRKTQKKDPVIEIECYLKKNFRKRITLEQLEQLFYLSGPYLSQVYKKEKGISIFHRLRQIRLEEAQRLLEKTSLSIQQIAQMCGYTNLSYFHRSFKMLYKMSPAEFRRKYNEH